ncbi:MAG: recombinase family protein [Bacilli bacterium]|nr:recombinase family protein [Bacilli bacterium]
MEKIIKKIIRVVLYIRVSTEEQAKYGYSLKAQLDRLKEYCKQKGYKIIEIYIDEGKSARTKLNNRKELLKLVEDAKEEKFDRIVVWRLDRWFRNVADYYKIQEVLEAHNISWECSDEDYNTNTAMGRYVLNLKLSDAQNESDKTSERIKFNFDNMIKNKKPTFGSKSLPLGFIVDGEGDKNNKNKRVIKNKEVENIVYDMFDNFELTHSIRKTLNYINDKYNLLIHYDSMRKYLKNPLYYGCYKETEDFCEAYITKERFNNIQSLVKKNNKDNKNKYNYIFSGLVRCPICGNSMSGCTHTSIKKRKNGIKTRHQYPYYRCNRHWSSNLCENNKMLSQNVIEQWLINHFKEELKKQIDNIQSISDVSTKNIVILNADKINDKLDRLNELYIEGRITKDKYDNDYNKFKEEIKIVKIQEETKRDTTKYKKILENASTIDIYKELTDENKRIFWSNYIEYIEENKESTFKIIFK